MLGVNEVTGVKYNNQINFCGKVLQTPELELAKKFASKKDIARFEQLVNRIEKTNDNIVYKLSQLKVTSIPEVNDYLILYCRNTDNYKLDQKLICRKIIPAENQNKAGENIYEGALKILNNVLGKKYSKK